MTGTIRMAGKLVFLLFLPVMTGGEATPGVQLAGFEDLFKLATESFNSQDTMQDRSDRSLANTYPFHLGEKKSSQGHITRGGVSTPSFSHHAQSQLGSREADLSLSFIAASRSTPNQASSYRSTPKVSPSTTSFSHHAQSQFGNKEADLSSSFIAATRTPSYKNQASSLRSSLFQPPAAQTNYQAQSGVPASSFHLNLQPQTQAQSGFTLLSGFGSRTHPISQYQIGSALQYPHNYAAGQVPAAVPSYQPAGTPVSGSPKFANFPYTADSAAYALQGYQQENEVPAITVANDGVIARVANQCPVAPSLSPQQCQGAVNACWSVGVNDVDCPGNSLCCFDGCANVCYGQARAVVRPAHSFVNPERKSNPAQKRRKPAGQTFKDVAAAGQRCIDKIEHVEEIEYDEIEECNHSYDKKCHTSYSTEYESQQEEECDDNYKKSCDITYSPHAHNVTVQVCMTPLVKDCYIAGPEVCRTEYISECWTKNDPHIVEDDVPSCRTEYEEKCVETQSGYVTEQDCSKWPREVCTVKKKLRAKFNPVTKCEKVPQELCGPSGCGFVPGPEECHDQVKTVVTDIPNEVCDLQPQRKCSHVTKLVPKLTPVEECVDVPKEICQKTKGNPRTVIKPVTKKWCYTPSQESGLA